MSDFVNWLTATHREVGRRRIAAGEARTALMRRRYEAPIEEVWDACRTRRLVRGALDAQYRELLRGSMGIG
jgi:hypothetical protein